MNDTRLVMCHVERCVNLSLLIVVKGSRQFIQLARPIDEYTKS